MVLPEEDPYQTYTGKTKPTSLRNHTRSMASLLAFKGRIHTNLPSIAVKVRAVSGTEPAGFPAEPD